MSDIGTKLEDAIITAIEEVCKSEEDKKETLKYYQGITVNEVIEETLEE